MTYADVFRPKVKPYTLLYDFLCIVGSTPFIALTAQVAIPLPFSPVPITGQTLAVLLTGVLLGSRRAGWCMFAYLVEGMAGLPVFAGGKAGIAHLLGPTGGYLLGFMPAAMLAGWLAEKGWDRRFGTALTAMFLGNVVIYLFGLPWLAYFVGAERVLVAGCLPFIPGDLIKILLATAMLPAGWKLLKRFESNLRSC
ncbi:MAG: hypothetical protein KatS3mg022_0760 [Armatimonadota bacterium]|nr:MAG: hypothetical protein KatS3mg022_0760 [Armatimonadota bacterium]